MRFEIRKRIAVGYTITTITTIYSTMKRSAAPSKYSNGVASKKMKIEKIHESHSNRKPANDSQLVPRNPKTLPSTPLNAKQQKAFHFLLSAAAYISVIEGKSDSTSNLREKCAINYHGYDDDHIGVAGNFLEGKGRYEILWQDGRISSGLGSLSGLTHGSLSDVILRPTLRGKNLITGRQILDKARACMLEAKKLLGYWMEFLVNDHFPSGTNEDNAYEHVLNRAREETSVEIDDDDCEGLHTKSFNFMS